MAEFEFVQTPEEFESFLRILIADGCTLVLDQQYESQKYEILTDVERYMSSQSGGAQIFIVNELFTRESLVFTRTENPIMGQFFSLEQGGGGAHLLLHFYQRREMGHIVYTNSLRYLSWYRSIITGYYRPPDEMKAYFGRMTKLVKKGTKPVEYPKGRKYWLSKGVWNLVETHGVDTGQLIFGRAI